jgi:GH24 family phage-related lysozyme (muramidase)
MRARCSQQRASPANSIDLMSTLSATRMKISPEGLALVKAFESFVPWVYDDKRPQRVIGGRLTYPEWKGERVLGTLTIGYGHTKWDGAPKITQGMRVTEAEAAQILDADLDLNEREVCEKVVEPMRALGKGALTQGEFDALVSFHFNCGGLDRREPMRRPSTACLAIQNGDREACLAAMAEWINPAWARKGLIKRRAAEAALFKGEEWRMHIP